MFTSLARGLSFHRTPRSASVHPDLSSFVFALAALLVVTATSFATGPIVKVLVTNEANEDVWVEITNTGSINATNRLYSSPHLPESPKTTALFEVLTGADASGSLNLTTLVPGDQFFALDSATGYVIVVTYVEPNVFSLPSGSTGFNRWEIPGLR
jgi:hypothetical protein